MDIINKDLDFNLWLSKTADRLKTCDSAAKIEEELVNIASIGLYKAFLRQMKFIIFSNEKARKVLLADACKMKSFNDYYYFMRDVCVMSGVDGKFVIDKESVEAAGLTYDDNAFKTAKKIREIIYG